jgi:hypothetical protein
MRKDFYSKVDVMFGCCNYSYTKMNKIQLTSRSHNYQV